MTEKCETANTLVFKIYCKKRKQNRFIQIYVWCLTRTFDVHISQIKNAGAVSGQFTFSDTLS